jgi:hypothetical protein
MKRKLTSKDTNSNILLRYAINKFVQTLKAQSIGGMFMTNESK